MRQRLQPMVRERVRARPMRQPILTKSDGGVTVERRGNSALYDRDEDMKHIVPRARYERGDFTAYCGFDCSNRQPIEGKPLQIAECIVCVEMYRQSRGRK